MMHGIGLVFILTGMNPFGGLFIAVPLAMFELHFPVWLAVSTSVALSYIQVIVVNLAWVWLSAWPAFVRLVERHRRPGMEENLTSSGSIIWITLFSPWIGPWLIVALARFANVPLYKIALPLAAGLTYVAWLTAMMCLYAPQGISHIVK